MLHSLATRHHQSSFPSFFFNDPPTTEISTLSLHDALPICYGSHRGRAAAVSGTVRAAGPCRRVQADRDADRRAAVDRHRIDRKSTRLNSSHVEISYAVFCLKKKKKKKEQTKSYEHNSRHTN